MTARGLIIGAPRSGSGKTSVTIGMLRALRRRGIRVCGAKSGPDYIDPGFHAAATGHPGVNLDSWAMSPGLLQMLLAEATQDADIVIVGDFGWAAIPPALTELAEVLAVRTWHARKSGQADVVGSDANGEPIVSRFVSTKDRMLLKSFRPAGGLVAA